MENKRQSHAELKPCPVCKGTSALLNLSDDDGPRFRVSCTSDDGWCDTNTYGDSENQAVERWNASARHVEAHTAQLVAALQYAVDKYGKPGGPWNVPGDAGGWITRARQALSGQAPAAPAPKPATDDNGIMVEGNDYPIGNTGWRLRSALNGIAELRTQLIDPNGCMLMEGYMMEPGEAARSLAEPTPAPSMTAQQAAVAIQDMYQPSPDGFKTYKPMVAVLIQQAIDAARAEQHAKTWEMAIKAAAKEIQRGAGPNWSDAYYAAVAANVLSIPCPPLAQPGTDKVEG